MSLEDEIKAECRLHAIEWVVSLHLAATFAQAGPNAETNLEEMRKRVSDFAQLKTFPRLGAAMSDLASTEREAAIDRLLGYAKDFLADIQQAGKS
jgi:hypothetical protein